MHACINKSLYKFVTIHFTLPTLWAALVFYSPLISDPYPQPKLREEEEEEASSPSPSHGPPQDPPL